MRPLCRDDLKSIWIDGMILNALMAASFGTISNLITFIIKGVTKLWDIVDVGSYYELQALETYLLNTKY